MTSCDLLVTANDGPLSSVFFHFTSIIRELPFASHGLAKEPGPVDPGGQSCGGSGAADATAGGALADGAGAEADAGAAALAEADVAGALSSLEQAASRSTAAAERRTVRIDRILDHGSCEPCSTFRPTPRSK
jgi:hypothetical protein